MELYTKGLCIALSISLLSSCAYLEGRKNQLETPPAKKSQKVIAPEPPTDTTPNPSATASKMLTPLTQ